MTGQYCDTRGEDGECMEGFWSAPKENVKTSLLARQGQQHRQLKPIVVDVTRSAVVLKERRKLRFFKIQKPMLPVILTVINVICIQRRKRKILWLNLYLILMGKSKLIR